MKKILFLLLLPCTTMAQTIHVKALVDSLSANLNRYYVFPDVAKKMAATIQQKDYSGIKDPAAIAESILADLQQTHHDGHLRLRYEGGMQAARDMKWMDLSAMEQDNFTFRKVEILPGNIGYLRFDGFTGFVREAKPVVNAALTFLRHTKAIIIDMRYNGGGSPDMVQQMSSYFFNIRTHLNDIINRIEDTRSEGWADPARTDSLYLSVPVYILTSKRTFSAAEDFTYGLQCIKRAVIVGEITGGGAHPVSYFNIGQGFVAGIPFARSENPITKTDWEGTGVIPDVKVNAEDALQAAIKEIEK